MINSWKKSLNDKIVNCEFIKCWFMDHPENKKNPKRIQINWYDVQTIFYSYSLKI